MTHAPTPLQARLYVVGDRCAFDEVAAAADPIDGPRHFASVAAFLAAAADLEHGGVILAPRSTDSAPLVALPEIGGQAATDFVLVALAQEDVALAVAAMRMGAADVIVRPCRPDELRQAITSARETARLPAPADALPRLGTLSSRERQVFDGIVSGMTNKLIGAALGISHRTVEIHRGRVMRKLGVTRLSQILEIGFMLRMAAAGRLLPLRRPIGDIDCATPQAVPQP